jgi:tRNA (cytidine32/uridine32-2'-O)-methyltransferase
MLDNVNVVLVCTSHPGNIGAVARAMKTMGLSRLTLVSPSDYPSEVAEARASGATDVLESARVVGSLAEALADCSVVIGASARSRHIPWPLMNPRQAGDKVQEAIAAGNQVALVFGRERTGLSNEELAQCHVHVNIPANPDYASLNLAAAVQVIAYEVRMAYLAANEQLQQVGDGQWGVSWDHPLATQQELNGFFQHLEETLVEIDFLDPNNPKQLMPRLRRLFQRAAPDKIEVNILRGILNMVRVARRTKE